ncbi:hypothetical protein FRB90_011463 [Tulasnella sp. 427]|nr:hypothetical protein FRB90_011463 [Tulasnella sp. 427]
MTFFAENPPDNGTIVLATSHQNDATSVGEDLQELSGAKHTVDDTSGAGKEDCAMAIDKQASETLEEDTAMAEQELASSSGHNQENRAETLDNASGTSACSSAETSMSPIKPDSGAASAMNASTPPTSPGGEGSETASAKVTETKETGVTGDTALIVPFASPESAAQVDSSDGNANMDVDDPDPNIVDNISGQPSSGAQASSSAFRPYVYGSSPYFTTITPTVLNNHQNSDTPIADSSTQATSAAISDPVKTDQDATANDSISTDNHDPNGFDLLPRITGLFRLLDLYSETGSGGLVDKIIISQESLGRFINSVLPGAYTNVTKIDFARLDREASLRLVGIYGSKSEIVGFLHSQGSIDDETAALLLVEDDESVNMRPSLRSGIYMLSPPSSDYTFAEPLRYVIYWPEETTWRDDATGSVRKNRVTFMRYLTSLTDQIRALISPEHEAKLVFKDADLDNDSDGEGFEMSWNDYEADVDDRLFKFEVAKTKEQEEAVHVKPGFTISHHIYRPSTAYIPTSRGSSHQITFNPQFIVGETTQAISTTRYVPGADHTRRLDESFTGFRFESELMKYGSVIIAPSVDDTGFSILLEKGNLKAVDRNAHDQYSNAVKQAELKYGKEEKETAGKTIAEIRTNRPRLLDQASKYLAPLICDKYPMFMPEELFPPESKTKSAEKSSISDPLEYFRHVCATSKGADQASRRTVTDNQFKSINLADFTRLKKRFLIVRSILQKHKDLSDTQRADLVNSVSLDGELPSALKETQASWGRLNPLHFVKAIAIKLNLTDGNKDEKAWEEHSKVKESDDIKFVHSLDEMVTEEPTLAESAAKLKTLALQGLRSTLLSSAKALTERMVLAQEAEVRETVKSLTRAHFEQAKHEATLLLRQSIESRLRGNGTQPILTIHEVRRKLGYGLGDFNLRASYSLRSEPYCEISTWVLDLSEDDIQKLKENPSHVPTPRMPRSGAPFPLPCDWRIRRLQIFGQKRALLVVDCPDKIRMWLFSLQTGFSADRPTCSIPNVAGRKYQVAADEQTRIVALAMTEPTGNVCLHEYLMDEKFTTMHSRGSPLELGSWYTEGTPEFTHVALFSGSEELCLVESTGRIRILSIPSRSFRPASVTLQSKPLYVSSSPDGTALIIVEGSPTGGKAIRVFHRASFGSNESGIEKELHGDFSTTSSSNFLVTATKERHKVFLMAFDVAKQRIISASLDISRKETQYQFQAKDQASSTSSESKSVYNSLIDCFSEVWGRFPVAAAIQRQTLSEDQREPPTITFVSTLTGQPFRSYFKRMVQDFERMSRKPTEQRLTRIRVICSTADQLLYEDPLVSQYRAGEWIAELLCLIPIHIAVTSENRFVPLKDGVLDSGLERELLGAEVSKIINSISLGWYESIFSSYMASKPVKVVSSMGEQSVGKSYSLNHMVDSSFAGSAVRTTEGVWLSVCPTRDCLVVALDFEGVHSIERTAQEDMLLVLFNTALSNLVIFRNNFALSRDVANMFTSFQASTHLFDPSANPRLFKGLLTIVIKDVVDGDKKDIVKEFFAKFSQIVSKEQATNFITVLHNSQLTVIPWSVIQSREFYALFGKLRNLLFSQKSTHGTAGEFLITLKTLMAKMKAQDWGSLDQTVIKHRVAALSDMLASALEYGRSGPSFDADDLRNLDDQGTVSLSGYSTKFYIGKEEAERDSALTALLATWGVDPARGSVDELVAHLDKLATSRIAYITQTSEISGETLRTLESDCGMEFDFVLPNVATASFSACSINLIKTRATTAEQLICAQRRASMPRNTTSLLYASFQPDTVANTSVIPHTIFVANLAIYRGEKAVKVTVPSRAITTKPSMPAPQRFTSAEWQEHSCRQQCQAAGICEINTTPHSVETTFTGKHSTFSYTKYTQRAKRLDCAIVIPPGELSHDGQHICTTDPDPFHYCEESCQNCGYICTLPLGHLQALHDTAHGSMERTAWAVEGNPDAIVEVQGRKFAAQDDGAPQLCSSICRNLGRHAHIDYCRNAKGQCQEPESEHIDAPMLPNRDRPKDWVSHKVFWARTGFKDPYSNDEQTEFALCDVQCAGPEHQATATAPARPSFCTLPIFHPPQPVNWQAPGNASYVSGDGHEFACPNPNNLRQAFHVIFVLDKSGSMACSDRQPLQGQPVTAKITRSNNNRFGAVLSAVYSFWITRGSGATGPRRDAYSVIAFDSYPRTQVSNDSTSSCDQLLDNLVQLRGGGGTDFDAALREARTTLANNWSNDRSPVVIFLSDGECWVNDNTVYDLCNEAVARGKPLSFHAVSFGQESSSASLRRMVTVAERVVQDAPRDPLAPLVPCSYSDAMDTIRLAETFINIADSLKKPRAALLRS